jgi:hypothetical protein
MSGRVLALTNPFDSVWSGDEADVGRKERTNKKILVR